MITSEDIMRMKGEKIKRLENLAKACAKSNSDDFKALWYKKMIDLANQYGMMDFVMRKLVH